MEERLDAALEDCRLRLRRGETTAQCLEAHPAHGEELRRLLPLAGQVAQLAQEPDAAFADAARERFHAQLAVEQRRHASRPARTLLPLRWLQRLTVPIAAVAVLATSGVGLVTASAAALPGSPLYPVQQAQEHVVFRLARTPQQQVLYQVRLAERRVQQVQRAEQGHAAPAVVNQLTASMLKATTRAARGLGEVPKPEHEKILGKIAPLLTTEERVLDQERSYRAYSTPAATAQQRRQLLAVQALLRADQSSR
jgi:hypothetical protein